MFAYCLNCPSCNIDTTGKITKGDEELTDEEKEFQLYFYATYQVQYDFELNKYDEVTVTKFETTIDKRESLLTDLVLLEGALIFGEVHSSAGFVISLLSLLLNHSNSPQAGKNQCYCVTKTLYDKETGEIVKQKTRFYYLNEEESAFYSFSVRWNFNGRIIMIN